MTYNKKIYLYNDNIGYVEYVQHMGNDKTIVQSARVSFGQDDDNTLNDKDKKLIRYLIKHRHTSTLEHCNITFKVKVPLFIRSQHHRHRTWSYNEWSNRYRDLTKPESKPEFYEPKQFRTQHLNNRQASNENDLSDPWLQDPDQWTQGVTASSAIQDHHKDCVKLYNQLMDAGVCREQARGVLPQNLYTSYFASANLSNILKFIDLRSHEGAQWEIVQVAKTMLTILEQLYPETVAAYNEVKNGKT
jgi:thymidylate synthase (FAD)